MQFDRSIPPSQRSYAHSGLSVEQPKTHDLQFMLYNLQMMQLSQDRRDASRRTSLKLYRRRMRQTVTSSPGQMTAFTPGPEMIRLLIVDDDPFQADAIQMLCHECGTETLST